MAEFDADWRALSIRQPWIDMILDGEKAIEVREWDHPPSFRGTFVLHAAWAIDWKTVALLDIDSPFNRHRGAFVGCANLVDAIELSAETNWRELLSEHRVIHPPVGDRTVWGLVLRNVRRFTAPIRGGGGKYFFSVPSDVRSKISMEIQNLDPTSSGVRHPPPL